MPSMRKRLLTKKSEEIIKKSSDSLKTATVHTVGLLKPVAKSPDESLRDLFDAVQAERVYADGKTFVDMVPCDSVAAVVRRYMKERKKPEFDLAEFVSHNFQPVKHNVPQYEPDETTTARQHVSNLWRVLERRNRRNRGSLIALPYKYITPGGRFEEQFYWDSYFIMLGLAADGRWRAVHDMMRNYTYMLRKFNMIPTANRTYFLSRSQPPFFARMVQLLAQQRGARRTYIEFLPSMLAEYRFWMDGRRRLATRPDCTAYRRVVRMSHGEILNRFYDDQSTPRPESQREDIETAEVADQKEQVYIDLRAAAESGWDFSSRWFRDTRDIKTIETTKIVPVDLNCLMYDLECAIAESYRFLKQKRLARRFEQAAAHRAKAIQQYCWNESSQFFEDFHTVRQTLNNRLTLAGVFPLYAGIATPEQAAAVAERIRTDFLYAGGVAATLVNNGQQWDLPNGWAPLQWVTIKGLGLYGYDELAAEIRDRWLALNESVFMSERKMVEKYDVVAAAPGGGGEYELQDGFGWTNGVYAALKDEQEKEYGA